MSLSFQCPDCGSHMTLVVVPGRFRCVCGAAFFARRSGERSAFPEPTDGGASEARNLPRRADVQVARDRERDLPRPADRVPRE